jgi:hypothetical protein
LPYESANSISKGELPCEIKYVTDKLIPILKGEAYEALENRSRAFSEDKVVKFLNDHRRDSKQ